MTAPTVSRGRVPVWVLVLYLVYLFAAWWASELLVVPRLAGLSPLAFALVRDVGLKVLLWLLPALFLMKQYEDRLALSRRDLFRAPDSWTLCLEVLALFAVCLLAGNLVRNHGLAIAPGFGLDDVLWLVFVGLCEETVFRGWLLNALWTRADLEGPSLPWKPVAVTSVLFLLIHFPIWQRTGALLTNLTGGAFLSILVLSVVFSWTLWKTRTLTVPILLHTAWDLLVTLLA